MSVLIRHILTDLPEGTVALGDIVLKLRRRSFGGILLFLTIISLLPIISFFAGLVIIVPALQMAIGRPTPILPQFIANWELSAAGIRSLGNRSLPWIKRSEQFIRPRWLFMTLSPLPMLIGAVIACLAFVLVLPLPLINVPPAIALFFLSLGILERDGVMIAIGLVTAAAALLIGFFMTAFAVEAVKLLFRANFG